MLTDHLALGDTVLLAIAGARWLTGFALCHTAPLVEGRAREELRVLKLVLEREADLEPMVRAARGLCAAERDARRVAMRVQGEYVRAYERLIATGRAGAVDRSAHDARGRAGGDAERGADLVERGADEVMAKGGIVWSNWEV